MKRLASTLVAATIAAALSTQAGARVHLVNPAQQFYFDIGTTVRNVAIDGDYAIAIMGYDGGRKAVLFRHDPGPNRWSMGPTLLDVPGADSSNDDLAMDSGVAAIRIGKVLHFFERNGSNYVEAAVAGTPQPAQGLSISGRSVLAARPGCAYDANLFEKSTGSGVWRVNGRITGPTSDCNAYTGMDLDGASALMRNSSTQLGEYRRSSTSLDWILYSTITAPSGVTFKPEAPALRGDAALDSDGHYFQRSDTGWSYRGRIEPLNAGNGPDPTHAAFRGDLLLTLSTYGGDHDIMQPYLYRANSSGGFDHVALLQSYNNVDYIDRSGQQVVTAEEDYYSNDGSYSICFFTLPTAIVAPRAVANDFDARNVAGIQRTMGNAFVLADTGGNYVYRQSNTTENHAKFTGTDWTDTQIVEADVTPTAFEGSDGWVGLAVRYQDLYNKYYITLRSSNKLEVKIDKDGTFSTLAQTTVPVVAGKKYHLRFGVSGTRLFASVDGGHDLWIEDDTFTHGSAALVTNRSRSDYDNVYISSTDAFGLANKPYTDQAWDPGESFTTQGGTWTLTENPDDARLAHSQTSTSGDARAYIGTATDDQRIDTTMRVDSWGSSTSGAWAGLLARWVDSKNFYYMTIRSTGRLEIRKQVNGVITTLKSVPFTATPGRYYALRFEALGNELHAYVDGKYMAGAIDDSIAKGEYGLGSYRAAFTYQDFDAVQP